MSRRVLLLEVGPSTLPAPSPTSPGYASWMPSVWTAPPPAAPAGFAVAAVLGGIRATWSAIADSKATYEVERAPDASGSPGTGKIVYTGADTTYNSNESARTHWRVRAKVRGKASAWTSWIAQVPDDPLNYVGGSGVNLLPDIYSTFQQITVPGLVLVNLTASRDAAFRKYEASLLLQRTASGTSGNFFLCPSLGYNIPHTPGRRYIVSFYYLTNTITVGALSLQDNVPVNSPASAITLVNNGQWNRVSAIVDASTLAGRYLALNLSFAGGNGTDVRIDGVMVEEAIGNLNQASAYSRGQASTVALQALAAAAAAQDTADGKIDTFFGPTAPAVASLGDLWFKSDEGNKQYRYNGSSWVVAQDTAIGTAIANAAGAQATADGKVRTFFGPEAGGAVATAVGDLWYVTDLATMYRWSGSSWVKVADNAATVIGTGILNPKFEAGKSGWTGFTAKFYWQGTGGVANSPRVVNIDTGGIRLYNEGRMPVRPGSILMLSAYMHRNGVAADGVAYLSAVIFDKDGNQVQVCDCPVSTTEIGIGSPQYIRKFTPVLIGTAAYAVFNLYTGITGAGGAWGFDSVNMVEIPDSKATQAGVGKNLLVNPDFGGSTGLLTPWFVTINTTGNPYTLRNYRDAWTYPTYKMPSGGNVEFRQAGGASAGVLDFATGKKIEVVPFQRYEAQIRYAVYRCNFQIYIEWTDAAGSVIGYSEGGAIGPNSAGSPPTLPNYALFGFFASAPAGAAYGRFAVRLYSTTPGQADSVGFFTQPFFGVATQNQSEFSEWSNTAPYTVDQLSDGNVYGNLALDDTTVSGNVRRLGLRISTSGQRLGSQRNFLQVGATTVRSTTALSATSAGAVSVAAFTQRYGSFGVNYSAVANAITGLTPNVTYVIYCIDDDFSGGVRTWFAGANPDAVMQIGDGVVIAGQIKIPTSGSSTGGGGGAGTNPGDWCVDIDTVLPDGRLVRSLQVGDLVPCVDVRAASPIVELHEVRAIGFGEEDCYRMVTASLASVVQSASTPMDLPDGRVRRTPEMLGMPVYVEREGVLRLDTVADLQFIGRRQVVKLDLGNRMFLAGERAGVAIATHNVQYKP